MAFEGYLQFSSRIEGESTDEKHKGWIEIIGFDMDILQRVVTAPSSIGGIASGKSEHSDLRFSKLMDRASPLLALAASEGTVFDRVTIELCRAGGEKVTFMTVELEDVIVSSISMNAGGDFPGETVTLNYGAIRWTYTRQSRSGGYGSGNVSAGWNRQENRRK